MVLYKIFGGLLFILGLLIIIGFPFFGMSSTAYHTPARSKAGVVVGFIIMAIGFTMAYFMD